MATEMSPQAEQQVDPMAGVDWPDLIVSPAHIRREEDHWVAILDRFSIVGQGETPGAAWQDMDELAVSYLDMCEAEGVPFKQVERPLPLPQRLRLQVGTVLRVLVARLLMWFLRDGKQGPQRREFVRAHPGEHDAQHALAC